MSLYEFQLEPENCVALKILNPKAQSSSIQFVKKDKKLFK